jgi:hypothetical protein
MAKVPSEIRSIARPHARTAIKVLAGIMMQETAPAAARVSAAQGLLDRGFGKPDQPIEAGDELKKVIAGIMVKFGAE